MTRRLAASSVTPNQVSVVNLGIGLLAAATAALGGYLPFLIGAALFQFASILDGTDGELAKLKFLTSRRGEWIDTLSDGLSYVAFLFGLTVGVARSDLPAIFEAAAIVGFVPLLLALSGMYAHVRRKGWSGSLLILEGEIDGGKGGFQRFGALAWPLLKRDFFSFFFLVLAVAGLLPLALPLFFIGACGLLVFSVWLNREVLSSLWRGRPATELPEHEAP